MRQLRGSIVGAARKIVVRLLPPIITDALRSVPHRQRAEWEYRPDGWPDRVTANGGWDHASVAHAHRIAWPLVLHRAQRPNVIVSVPSAAERPSVGAYGAHNTLMTFAYVLGRAADTGTRVSMLDWGCGMGEYAVFARGLFPNLDIEFSCREMPLLVESGREALPGDSFHDDDAAALGQGYDLVVASGSVQYVRDWRRCVEALAGVADRYLYITRLPIVRKSRSYVGIQRPGRSGGYQTEYPGWFLQRAEFLTLVERGGFELDREFLVQEDAFVPGAPEQPEFRGFLFASRGAR